MRAPLCLVPAQAAGAALWTADGGSWRHIAPRLLSASCRPEPLQPTVAYIVGGREQWAFSAPTNHRRPRCVYLTPCTHGPHHVMSQSCISCPLHATQHHCAVRSALCKCPSLPADLTIAVQKTPHKQHCDTLRCWADRYLTPLLVLLSPPVCNRDTLCRPLPT